MWYFIVSRDFLILEMTEILLDPIAFFHSECWQFIVAYLHSSNVFYHRGKNRMLIGKTLLLPVDVYSKLVGKRDIYFSVTLGELYKIKEIVKFVFNKLNSTVCVNSLVLYLFSKFSSICRNLISWILSVNHYKLIWNKKTHKLLLFCYFGYAGLYKNTSLWQRIRWRTSFKNLVQLYCQRADRVE